MISQTETLKIKSFLQFNFAITKIITSRGWNKNGRRIVSTIPSLKMSGTTKHCANKN